MIWEIYNKNRLYEKTLGYLADPTDNNANGYIPKGYVRPIMGGIQSDSLKKITFSCVGTHLVENNT